MRLHLPTASGLTTCQEKAFDMLERQGNVFLTGAAGTGKSYLLAKYLDGKPSEDFPVVASTGAAAVIIGGRTFHSFFGLGILEGGIEAAVARALRSRKLVRRLQRACCVVIDEVSMLSGATLGAAERVSRLARGVDEPWGGLRIIAVGDFAQLPPVTPGNQGKDWAFLHPLWEESDFQPALLSTVMRTQDADFLDILNFVRIGTVNEAVCSFLDARTDRAEDDEDGTRLYPRRAQAEEHNLRRLHALMQPIRSFQTEYIGDGRFIESAKKSLPIPDSLLLSEGALVMMRKNDISGEQRYVNGSLGYVREINEEEIFVSLFTGEEIEVKKEIFTTLDGDGNEILGARNFPVTLAWATTIHKAQGASLDRMIVDLESLWEPGQAYVALSRVRSASGLTVERWHPSSIRAERLVTDFYDHLSQAAKKYEPRPLFAVPKPSLDEEPEERHERRAMTRKNRSAIIRALLHKGASLEDMAKACRIRPERVILYIEEFIGRGDSVEIGYLLSDIPDVPRIREAFEEYGLARLRPVFEALDETVSYPSLRLVRCAMRTQEST